MDSSVFDPLKETMDKLASQLILLLCICSVVYILVFWLLRKFKLPYRLSNIVATFALVGTLLYIAKNGLLPGFQNEFWK